ncbi:hypothetical protein EFM17_03455 [Lactobacillus delbrueckii]|nr:hypothetical protein [Lactobacillus delbrueckii]
MKLKNRRINFLLCANYYKICQLFFLAKRPLKLLKLFLRRSGFSFKLKNGRILGKFFERKAVGVYFFRKGAYITW